MNTIQKEILDEDFETYHIKDIDGDNIYVAMQDDGSGIIITDDHDNHIILYTETIKQLRTILRYSRTKCLNMKLKEAFPEKEDEEE